ncbi:MAG: 30S ribosomal protein S12 methylthiotransferase RimO [Proteobacteria bacterium]|nr:30S ribosomal protein S12 methylthiotransferase RimO [Pseudomonadota bacterium]
MPGRLPVIQPTSAAVPSIPSELQGDGRKVHFVSLGCPKNRTDSEAMLARMGQAGWELSDDPGDADVIVVNSCTFIDDATKESIDTVLEMAEYKTSGKAERLVVTGCMAQRHHDALRTELPEVDAFVGTGDYHRILDVVAPGSQIADLVGDPVYVQGGEARVNTLTAWSAYVKILEGCPQRCTFCIIPKLRGDLMSRPLPVLVDEVRALAGAGIKEINLVGQDSNSWGRDIGSDRLPDLLHAFDGIDGIDWVRLMYSYPAKFNDALIDTIAELHSIVPYLDMPLQHISNPILKAMRRGVSKDRTERLLEKLRSRIDGVAIRTGFIVGFPGETDAQFQELYDFVEAQRFDNVGVFTFSPQDETPAAHLPDQLDEAIKQERRDALMTLQQGIHAAKSEQRVGDVIDVLIEGTHPEQPELLWKGRAATQAPEIDGCVIVTEAKGAKFGDIVPMEVVQAAGYDLVCEAV